MDGPVLTLRALDISGWPAQLAGCGAGTAWLAGLAGQIWAYYRYVIVNCRKDLLWSPKLLYEVTLDMDLLIGSRTLAGCVAGPLILIPPWTLSSK